MLNLLTHYFKTRLDKYWSDQLLLYDFDAELAATGDRSKCDIEVYSLVISLVCYKDRDIDALVPASVSHHCLVLF